MDARIYINGDELLYSSAANDDTSALINPQVKAEIGKAGSLTFTILPTHPMYNDLLPFKTFARVEIDGTEIFKGRVLDTSKDMYNQKSVTCEGDLTYLMDSVCTPGDYNETVTAFFKRCIGWHNSQVEDAKKLTAGNVTISSKDRKINFDISSYTSIADTIETEIIGYYGGYLRTRNQNGTRYIDIVKEGDSSSNQVIEYGSQMLDLTNDESANDLFTILLAVGDSDSQDGTDYDFPTYKYEVPGAVAKYGRITHVESFSGIKDKAELEKMAKEYVENHYDPYPTELTIKAIDLHILDGSIQTIVVGNTVKIQSTPHNLSKNLMCVSIDYDLQNPENTSYVFGHPKQSLSQRQSKEKKAAKAETAKASKSGKKGGGGAKKNAEDLETEKQERKQKEKEIVLDYTDKCDKLTLRANAFEANVTEHFSLVVHNGEVIQKINASKEGLLIDFNKVHITGQLIVEKLAQLSAVSVNGLVSSGYIAASGKITAPTIGAAEAFTLGGQKAVWQDTTVITDISGNSDYKSNLAITFDGSTVAGSGSISYLRSVTGTAKKIHYLGRSATSA